MKISKNTILLDLVERYPELAEILVFKYGLHCVGCGMAQMETLEEGALAHGMKASEIKSMIEYLNKQISKEASNKKPKSDSLSGTKGRKKATK